MFTFQIMDVAMPDPGSTRPALSEAVLHESVDLMGKAIISLSEQLDRHGLILSGMHKIVLDSLAAAGAAKAQTDPERYGRYIGNELDKALERPLARLDALQAGFATDREETARRLDELALQEETMLGRLRDDLDRAGRWKRRIPFIAFFGLLLALALGIALPRFMAGNATTCAVLGGQWMYGEEGGKEACVFFRE